MLLYAGDEKRRSQLYHIVVGVSSLLIIMVVGFFVMRIFTGNPLTGRWASMDSDLILEIKDSGKASVTVAVSEDISETIDLAYTSDPEDKTIVFTNVDTDALKMQEATSDADMENSSEDSLETVWAEITPLLSTLTYSVDGNELTLSDTEFGEQMVFSVVK